MKNIIITFDPNGNAIPDAQVIDAVNEIFQHPEHSYVISQELVLLAIRAYVKRYQLNNVIIRLQTNDTYWAINRDGKLPSHFPNNSSVLDELLSFLM